MRPNKNNNKNTSTAFIDNFVVLPLNYEEIAAVCLTFITSKPTIDTYKQLIPQYTRENIDPASGVLVPLQLLGNTEFGHVSVADQNLVHGVEYERDEFGNIKVDEKGNPIILEDHGVIWGTSRNHDIHNFRFNAIVAYSKEKDEETGNPAIGFISTMNNSLTFQKILNFCVRYIITVNMEMFSIELEYLPEYKKHSERVSSNTIRMKQVHGYLYDSVVVNNISDTKDDWLTNNLKEYKNYLTENSLYIKPVKTLFSKIVKNDEIEYYKDFKINKFSDNTIRSMYIYFYYNLDAVYKVLHKGIIKETDKKKGEEDYINKIAKKTLRQHIKLGFNEVAGPFLYTWLATPNFVYVIVFGSNSNNNVDIYRVENKDNDNYKKINDISYNLVVGKNADRIYFTINGDLHVCTPCTKDKQEIVMNKPTVDKAKNEFEKKKKEKESKYDENIYLGGDNTVDKVYEELLKDIRKGEDSKYYISEEQFYVFMMSKYGGKDKGDKVVNSHITDGVFQYKGDTVPPPTSAKEYIEDKKEWTPDADAKINAIKYIKWPIDKINSFIKDVDIIVKECEDYEKTFKQKSHRVSIPERFGEAVKEQLRSGHSINGDSYVAKWNDVKTNVIIHYIKAGSNGSVNDKKYEDYAKKAYEGDGGSNKGIGQYIPLIPFLNIFNIKPGENYKGNPLLEQISCFYENTIYGLNKDKEDDQKIENTKEYMLKYMSQDIYRTKAQMVTNLLALWGQYNEVCFYEAYFNFNVESTRNLHEFVLKKWFISKIHNNPAEVDKINKLTVQQAKDKFYNEQIKGKRDASIKSGFGNNGTWWDETKYKDLIKLYEEVATMLCSDRIPYGKQDTFYYNGEEKKNISLERRNSGIPYRYNFCYPDYMYNNDWSEFKDPPKPLEKVEGTYHSLIALKNALMRPVAHGEVDKFTELNDLVNTITESYSVANKKELDDLLIVAFEYSDEESMNAFTTVKGEVNTSADLSSLSPSPADTYYIKNEKKYKQYDGEKWNDLDGLPVIGDKCRINIGSSDQPSWVYYKLSKVHPKITWESFIYPSENTVYKTNDNGKFYVLEKVEGIETWVEYTLEKHKESFKGKKYFVKNNQATYEFDGKVWKQINTKYNIKEGTVYEVTNTPETVTEDVNITNAEDNNSIYESEELTVFNKEYKITLNGVVGATDEGPDGEQVAKTYKIKIEGSGINKTETVTFKPEEKFTKPEIIIKVTPKEQDPKKIKITLENLTVSYIKGTYDWIRQPGDTGRKYYVWRDNDFHIYDMKFSKERNYASFILTPVYFNLFLEGEKLIVVRNLFENRFGTNCKVTQLDFSDLGDVVMVHNYNHDGQVKWGGVFSRSRLSNGDGGAEIWGNSVVVSDNVIDCINWEYYQKVAWSYDKEKNKYILDDDRLTRIRNLYEVSKNHYEVLSRIYTNRDDMRFSNSITVCKMKIEETGVTRLFVYTKNMKVLPHAYTVKTELYNVTDRVDINNYLVIIRGNWIDTAYDNVISMNDNGSSESDYEKKYLIAERGLCVVELEPHKDEQYAVVENSGAVSFFDINVWHDSLRPAVENKDWLFGDHYPTKMKK